MSFVSNFDSSEKVLEKIEASSKKLFLPIVGREKGKLLEFLVRRYQPSKILEIGTLVGYSAILMAKNLEKGKITCIEISQKAAEIARKNIKEAGFKNIKVIVGDALEAILQLKEKFSLVFIDALKEEYLFYLRALEKNRNLKKGTIIVADNAKIFAENMQAYLNYVRHSGKYKSRFVDFINDGVEISVKL